LIGTTVVGVDLGEGELFYHIASKKGLTWKFLKYFACSDSASAYKYDRWTASLEDLYFLGTSLEPKGLCEISTNGDKVDMDIYVDLELTDTGIKFRDFLLNYWGSSVLLDKYRPIEDQSINYSTLKKFIHIPETFKWIYNSFEKLGGRLSYLEDYLQGFLDLEWCCICEKFKLIKDFGQYMIKNEDQIKKILFELFQNNSFSEFQITKEILILLIMVLLNPSTIRSDKIWEDYLSLYNFNSIIKKTKIIK